MQNYTAPSVPVIDLAVKYAATLITSMCRSTGLEGAVEYRIWLRGVIAHNSLMMMERLLMISISSSHSVRMHIQFLQMVATKKEKSKKSVIYLLHRDV